MNELGAWSDNQRSWPLDPQQPIAEHQDRTIADDAQRQSALDTLTQAWRTGKLDRDEFSRRSQKVLAAEYLTEIDQLTAGLGNVSGYLAPQRPGAILPAPPAATVPIHDSFASDEDSRLPGRIVSPDTPANQLTLAVMSGAMRAGRWVVPRRHVVVGALGGATVDLRDAVFTSPEVTITCIAVMGGIDVIVPPEMDVRVNGLGFMGAFGWSKLNHAHPRRTPSPEDPIVHINGLGFWGGVDVTRKKFNKSVDPPRGRAGKNHDDPDGEDDY